MTPEEKKHLDAIKKIHLDGVAHPLRDRERCYICFLLTLLDQAQRDTELKEFQVRVFPEDAERREKLYKVIATTSDDAMQLAFALDGGWGKDRDATGMLELAKMHTALDQAALARGEGEK